MIWSFRKANMQTYTVVEGKVISHSSLHFPDITIRVPSVNTFPLPDYRTPRNHLELSYAFDSWNKSEEPIQFDMLFSTTQSSVHGMKAVYGYRYRIDISENADGTYGADFKLLTPFTLPPIPIPSWYSTECEPPGRLGLGFGSGAVMRFEGEQRRGFSLYSLPKRVLSSDTSAAPEVRAQLACLQARDRYWQRACVATGRFFWADWRAPSGIGVAYVCDLLTSWNDRIV